ncbi:hypothetical protein GO986_15195 [Deinococcus sp. HMF7620]|uniref:Uncharacterized protein n=1 Tax=Deinococcus arboris TaxID=2682977 RepID=A0A7C9LNI1_9DEIO|nr:hypothetical protein [Deinococcus arboris]MVN88097.1 hypothetical protein [Deinococcus arboris]
MTGTLTTRNLLSSQTQRGVSNAQAMGGQPLTSVSPEAAQAQVVLAQVDALMMGAGVAAAGAAGLKNLGPLSKSVQGLSSGGRYRWAAGEVNAGRLGGYIADASQDARLAKFPRNEWPAAKDFWPTLRTRTDDVPKIAKLVGMPEEEVLLAKQHLMVRYQLIRLDDGIIRVSRFEPNVEDAILWQRVTNGEELKEIEIKYLRMLVKHEHEEAKILSIHPGLMTEFLEKGDLFERLVVDLKIKGLDTDKLLLDEGKLRPVTPYRYAHIIAHQSGARQPNINIGDIYSDMGLIDVDLRYQQYMPTAKGKTLLGLK